MNQATVYRAGLDIGSTTAKMAVLDEEDRLIFSAYERHHAQVYQKALDFLHRIATQFPGCRLDLKLTGSAALGTSGNTGLPFVQEVIAAHKVVREKYPGVNTAMDIGGEDSKMIFFESGRAPDIRMNGSCAGGTGAFIDQMATLMEITPQQLNDLARDHSRLYPVASRCGVFAKTDVQNMFSRNIPHSDIAASIFHAVILQCINSLARGREIQPKILLCGGVFTFLPELVRMLAQVLGFSASDVVLPEHSELIPAMGSALTQKDGFPPMLLQDLIARFETAAGSSEEVTERIAPLFNSPAHFEDWKENAAIVPVPVKALEDYAGTHCFLGIDSGSTTTKITILGESKEILFSWYETNGGTPVKTVIRGLSKFRSELQARGRGDLKIICSAVTGYGEDLIRSALGLDIGIVETMAHLEAARFVDPDVSFILDIGGQDMKAMFIENGMIGRIEVNEACSSGCGSFLQTLAGSLNYTITEFAEMACRADAPCDLGTRCTVFMNSKIKQALRENAGVENISAGLSASVIKNCLFKVLKLASMDVLGDHIVLQGGTFKNPSIVRALEQLTGKQVSVTRIPELMGAYGAALNAHDHFSRFGRNAFAGLDLDQIETALDAPTRELRCKGCENQCRITRYNFPGGRIFYSGNKCEKHYHSKGQQKKSGFNFTTFKYDAIFKGSKSVPDRSRPVTLGIPRSLNAFDNYAFWQALFSTAGIDVVLSPQSTHEISEKGLGTVMSDNICFPAKLVHGHIWELAEREVDRIFYPIVVYEKNEFEQAMNAYNCPIVSSYADVVESSIDPEKRWQIPLDRPVVNFNDPLLLKKMCRNYLKSLGVGAATAQKAYDAAVSARRKLKAEIRTRADEIIQKAEADNSLLIVLAGRPYHADSLINHRIPEILSALGADTITEDAVPVEENALDGVQVVTQWSYPNRIYAAAQWVAAQPDHVQMVQLNSFGCGPDAVVIDEVRDILRTGGKNHTLIKVDEISNPGSVRLRLRSMVESLARDVEKKKAVRSQRKPFPVFRKQDRKRTIWAPFFSEDYSAYLPVLFKKEGYDFRILPPPDRESVDIGLQHASHDICYPGIIVIGDIIKALKKDTVRADEIAVAITQTGGQCRASNYLSLIRKAMVSSGYEEVPIISVNASGALVEQPGFEINWLKKLRLLFIVTMYADCIAKMYYATAAREKLPGTAEKVRQHFMKAVRPLILKNDTSSMMRLLDKAVAAFNELPVHGRQLPRMGVVGEIYAKYNYFANQDLVHWLMRNGIEPVLPPIVDYFIQDLVNYRENIRSGVRRRKLQDLLGQPIEWLIRYYHHKICRIFSKFRFGIPFDDIHEVAENASRILSMTNQFGEGWLIPGEIAAFADNGIHHVISAQPFGCIANHIISKGVETRIRAVYPQMNLYHLDFDAGMSEANVQNRLHFMIEHL